MAITPTQVTNAFSITSGSTNLLSNNLNVTYIKNSNTIPADIPVVVSNAASNFYIKAYPVPSTQVLQVYRSGSSVIVDEANPIIIPPNSLRDLVVRLSTTLESLNPQIIPESIKFNLVAMIIDKTSTTTGQGVGGGGGDRTQPFEEQE
jgi:hypothetical protein